MHQKQKVYLRSLRVRAGLAQEDVRKLLGFKSRAAVSMIEDGSRRLRTNVALHYALIFNVALAKIIESDLKQSRRQIAQRAKGLLANTEGFVKPKTRKKRKAFLKELTQRVTNSSNNLEV